MTGPTTSSGKSPGWYEDDNGLIRWWSGEQWDDASPAGPAPGYGAPPPPGYAAGPPGYAPPPPGYGPQPGYPPPGYGAPYAGYAPARTDGRTLAMLAHLGVFVGGFILPLIIYLTTGKTDPYVRHHSAEALNFSLFYLLFVFVGMGLSLITLGFGLILFFPLFIVFAVLHVVWAIMGAVKANQGEWWKYPVNIRFVQGAIR